MNLITEFALEKIKLEEHTIENCWIMESNDGKPIIKVRHNEKEYFIGSKYNIEKDLERFLSITEDMNVNTIFIVFGLGTGQHVLQLLNKMVYSNKLIIVEPDLNILASVWKSEIGDKIFGNDRVVIAPMDKEIITNCLIKVVENFNLNNIKIKEYANYDKIYTEEFQEFYKTVKYYVETGAVNINTELVYAKQFFRCFMSNLKHITESVPVNNFRNLYSNVPAVVVSAGPSLEKNIHLLKEVKGKFIIIAGGRTVKPLQQIGIKPDFIAVIDPSEACYKLVENNLECTAPLVYNEFTNYDVVERLPGKKIFYQEGYSLSEVTPKLIGQKVDALYQGGSVAHSSAAFANYIGCNPILFIGQDFAYTGDKVHASIANFENSNEFKNKGFLVDDIYGEKVRTDFVMNTYRIRMEIFIKLCKNTTFINCTEGGANMEGTTVMDFKEAIEKYMTGETHGNKETELLTNESGIDREKTFANIRKLVSDMHEVRKDCTKAIKYSDQILQHYTEERTEDITKLLNRIKKINKRIQKINFLDTLLKPTTFKIMMHPDYCEKLNETQKEMGLRLAKQTKNLYEDIIVAIDEALPIIEANIE